MAVIDLPSLHPFIDLSPDDKNQAKLQEAAAPSSICDRHTN